MARQRSGQAVAGYLGKHVFAPRYQREERLWLTTKDEVRLAAWRLDGPPDAPATVVLAHGFMNWSRSPRVHAFARLLARRLHVVVPDLRGHGQSDGHCSMGRLEELDVVAAIAAARPGLPVVTVGVSMGAAAVLVHAGHHPGSVAGVVAISAPAAWTEPYGEGAARVQRWVSGRAGRLTLATLLRTRVGGTEPDLPQLDDLVPRIAPAFTVIVHDPEDWYFGGDHAERIYGWAHEPKELWWRPGAGHGRDLLTADLADAIADEISARVARATQR